MYNGIGLTTPRGSGTNGYVQTNYSSVRNKKPNNNNYQQKERKDLLKIKSPNVDLLIHEEKKKVEIELYKLKSELTKQGKLTPEEIDQEISDKRKERMKLIESKYNNNNKEESKIEENYERNEKFKKALSLDKEFEKKGIKSNQDAELVAFDSKLNEMMKRKEKPSSLEKKQRKKKRKHSRKDSSESDSSDSSSESASSSDSDE